MRLSSGRKTGGETKVDDVTRVKKALPEVPLIVGSGVTIENVDSYLPYIDAIIVTTGLNVGGEVEAEPDPVSVSKFMEKIKNFRKNL